MRLTSLIFAANANGRFWRTLRVSRPLNASPEIDDEPPFIRGANANRTRTPPFVTPSAPPHCGEGAQPVDL